tara:strand:- start:27 stop:308 length:282 start_codon:yes stop_codon:yes gene_type:complete
MPNSGKIILTLLWIGIAVSSIAVGMINDVVRNLGAKKENIRTYLRPLFPLMLAILLLGERFEIFHRVAFVIDTGGIWLFRLEKSVSEDYLNYL